ncbi:MAG: hypothetical protein QM733_06140 [Ilumatobacteraceae bacterium]
MPAGSVGVTRAASSDSLTPGSAARLTLDSLPGWPSSSCDAWPVVKNVIVAPPSVSWAPNAAMPTMVTCCGCGVRTTVRSPTCRSPSLADSLSIATSPAASGARPSTMR